MFDRFFSKRFCVRFVTSVMLVLSGFTGHSASLAQDVKIPAKQGQPALGGEADQQRPAEPDAAIDQPQPMGQFTPPTADETRKMQRLTPNDDRPAGITLMDRMGIPLPDLPKEKPYKGKIDLAYGAYQRGLFGTAFDLALPKAKAGDGASQTLMGELLSHGFAVKQDMKAAAFWYGQAAKNNDPAAMFKYSLMLMEGKYVKADKVLADQYMQRAADSGNSSAQFNWAQILVSENPGPKGLQLALPYYEKSADQGVADAQYAVSQIYRNLSSVPPEKRKLARDYLLKAARAGFDTAQLDLGIWLMNGIEGPQDLDAGFKWLSVAANRGNVSAQNRLSHAYFLALGTRPDPVQAAKWYIISRRAGLNDSQLEDFYLGMPDYQQKKALEEANKFRSLLGLRTSQPNQKKETVNLSYGKQEAAPEIPDLPGVSLDPKANADDDSGDDAKDKP